MSRLETELSLSDLITAVKVLKADEEGRERIAKMLGFGLGRQEETPTLSYKETNLNGVRSRETSMEPKIKAPTIMATKEARERENEFTLEITEENYPMQLHAMDMPEPLKYFSEMDEPLPEHLPLLNPIWTRAIITKMLSVYAYEGSPDISTLIEIISLNLPFKQIPKKLSTTLRRGVQLLIDTGPGLVPYSRDQVSFLHELRNIVGNDGIEVWTFKGTPLMHALSLNEPPRSNYRLPLPGTPILMLTDLGIASPLKITGMASIDEWRKFIQMVQRARCPLSALVPYKSSRWPKPLKKLLTIIQWDRKTTDSNITQFLL